MRFLKRALAFAFMMSAVGAEARMGGSVHRDLGHFGNQGGADSRPWRQPQFSSQKSALGYSQNAFAVPKGMQSQVQFWVDIYTKYSTLQGVIHDGDDVSQVYAVVSLAGLTGERQKQQRIDQVKTQVARGLKDPAARARLRFQLGQRDRMLQGIYHSGRYLEEMETVFRKAGLPIELTRLVFVESSFNIMARSKVGASGIWQIMPYTAKPHLTMSPLVDKRNHPLEATRFAARLLRDNYRMLKSWPLAVTGYNHGPTGVFKMTQTYRTKELGYLVKNVRSRKSFGFASRNFYASFLAALEVERNADHYFGRSAQWSKPLASMELKLPVSLKYKELLTWFGGDDRKAQLFNPHLNQLVRQGGAAIPVQTSILIPKDKYNLALISFAKKNRMVAMEVAK